jgi:hypothetical protein
MSNPSKPVAQLKGKKIVHIYSSAYVAARQTGLSYSHIQDTCHKRRCGVGGYKWRYATELEAKYAHLYNDNTEST